MKRKKLLILIIVLLLAGVYVYSAYIAPQSVPPQAASAGTNGAPDAPAAQSGSESAPGETALSGLSLIADDDSGNAAAAPDSDVPVEPVAPEEPAVPAESVTPEEPGIDEDGAYTSRDDVALYLHTYGHLPDNFITKKEAEALGWEGGGLDDYAFGKCIGGSHYGNYEGLLPERQGRRYTECDIDTMHRSSRGPKRIVFSNDGLIYYTDDHYGSFTLLYGEE